MVGSLAPVDRLLRRCNTIPTPVESQSFPPRELDPAGDDIELFVRSIQIHGRWDPTPPAHTTRSLAHPIELHGSIGSISSSDRSGLLVRGGRAPRRRDSIDRTYGSIPSSSGSIPTPLRSRLLARGIEILAGGSRSPCTIQSISSHDRSRCIARRIEITRTWRSIRMREGSIHTSEGSTSIARRTRFPRRIPAAA